MTRSTIDDTPSGLRNVERAFDSALSQQKAALMPYFTLGYPDIETSLDIVEAIAPYSDLIELGVPFSDPIADGPTIQRSTQKALDEGTTVSRCIEMTQELRNRGVTAPLLLMGYYNPILAYGEERYTSDLASAGGDGLIVPDLPPEEAEELRSFAVKNGLALISFLAPSSSSERISMAVSTAVGFIYMVSVTGVTGARSRFSDNLAEFVSAIRNLTEMPIAVGFGISSPEQASDIGDIADGVIVGSALINTVDAAEDKPEAAASVVFSLRTALAL
jgi:tryptophan synthase alpha chain